MDGNDLGSLMSRTHWQGISARRVALTCRAAPISRAKSLDKNSNAQDFGTIVPKAKVGRAKFLG